MSVLLVLHVGKPDVKIKLDLTTAPAPKVMRLRLISTTACIIVMVCIYVQL